MGNLLNPLEPIDLDELFPIDGPYIEPVPAIVIVIDEEKDE